MLHITSKDGVYVASINKQDKLAHHYRPEEPWLLLFRAGRTDHFVSLKEAKAEARKTWPGCRFSVT